MSGDIDLAATTDGGALNYSASDDGVHCNGVGGFDDITMGAQVTVYDRRGTVVGVGNLDAGTVLNGNCDFAFTVDDLPVASPFFSVEVTHRGRIQVSRADAQSGNVTMSLGT